MPMLTADGLTATEVLKSVSEAGLLLGLGLIALGGVRELLRPRPARLVEIAPCSGWVACYRHPEDIDAGRRSRRRRFRVVAAWALMEAADGRSWVVGLTSSYHHDDNPHGSPELVDCQAAMPEFVGYAEAVTS